MTSEQERQIERERLDAVKAELADVKAALDIRDSETRAAWRELNLRCHALEDAYERLYRCTANSSTKNSPRPRSKSRKRRTVGSKS